MKVTLTEKEKGASIQARRGYFAPIKRRTACAGCEGEKEPANAESPLEKQLRKMTISKKDIEQLPVELTAKPSAAEGGTHLLAVSTHLDTKSLHFQKQGDRNTNTVVFVFAVFDQKRNICSTRNSAAPKSMSPTHNCPPYSPPAWT